jgi:sugar lactone lactonase YvrE
MSYVVFHSKSPVIVRILRYQLNYKKFATEEIPESTNAILLVTNQGSLFTLEAMMNFDKIQQERDHRG